LAFVAGVLKKMSSLLRAVKNYIVAKSVFPFSPCGFVRAFSCLPGGRMQKYFISVVLFLCSIHLAFAENTLSLTSTATSTGGMVPVLYTCDGKNVSPQLAWKSQANNIKSFALVVSDPDAPSGTFYHWVLYNIPSTISEFAEGISPLPTGTISINNSFGHANYDGPCPPKGMLHHYIFTLYGLDSVLTIPTPNTAKELIDAMKGHIIQKTETTMVFSRT